MLLLCCQATAKAAAGIDALNKVARAVAGGSEDGDWVARAQEGDLFEEEEKIKLGFMAGEN